jgi:hypothetical protein
MPDILDDFFDDDFEESALPPMPEMNAPPGELKAWLEKFNAMAEEVFKGIEESNKSLRAELAKSEPMIAAWYAEVETLSAKRWRTLAEQRRLEQLIDRIDRQPELVRRMGPPPWPKDVIDTKLAN